VDARGSDATALTHLCPPTCVTRIHGELEMNAGYFEQISDCWPSEGQPAKYYRTAAARARMLQADATTPRVRQYLDKMIAHCERLGGSVDPGVSPRSDRRYAGRTRLAIEVDPENETVG